MRQVAWAAAVLGALLGVASCSNEDPSNGGLGSVGNAGAGGTGPIGAGATTDPSAPTGASVDAGGIDTGGACDPVTSCPGTCANCDASVAVPTPNCDEATIGTHPNTLAVSVSTAAQVIHKEIFGVLMEILGKDINDGLYVGTGSAIPNTQGIRNDIIDGFKEAGVGAIQWPGGCAANGYDWAANVDPPNTMGTDLFMELCNWIDAEPYLVGRPQPQYAQSNADWVAYVNDNPSHPDWNLKYFKVGNEVWGCGGNLGDDEATYETWYDAHHALLSQPVNGKELFLVGATGGIWTVHPSTTNWLTTMLSPGHLAEKIDGIEVHDYVYFPDTVPSVGFSENQYYDIVDRANEGQIAPRIRDIETILDAHDPSGRIKIMEDEWGDWLQEWKPGDTWLQQVTLMDAISAAEQLHVFMAHADRVQMGGLAQATNVIHSLFLTNSSSGGSDLVKTPAFYVFKMFVPHHVGGAKWAPSTLASENITGGGKTFPVLSAGTTVNTEGVVHISLANVDLVGSRAVTVTIDGPEARYVIDGAQVITGPAKDSYNDFGKPEAVNVQPLPETSYAICGRKLEVTLPAKSVVMLVARPVRG